ncbi:MAG: hypothetical protein CVU97_07610, partial [Firmicutes bacterium HGW-Firmicutes-21]
MNPITAGKERTDNYDFQFRADDTNFYFAFKLNKAPIGTDTYFGNGIGTNLRLWIKTNDAATVYTHFLNVAYKNGTAVTTCHENESLTENKRKDVADWAGLDIGATYGSDYWYVEVTLPFASIGATDSANFFVSCSSPLAIDTTVEAGKVQPTNNSLSYGKWATSPHSTWDVDADINIVFADVKLGEKIILPPPP